MKYLIIGAGPGIGRSLAKQFGHAGFDILMIGRDAEKLQEIKRELAADGINAAGIAFDVSDPVAYQAMIREVAAQHSDVQVVHYNASSFNPAPPSKIDLEVFTSDLHTCITGALLTVQAFLPVLRQHEKAAIFMTGGGSALHPAAATTALSIGKAGMRNLALALAEECAPTDIHVATITVSGFVQPGSSLDPDHIAAEFRRLWMQEKPDWEVEVEMK